MTNSDPEVASIDLPADEIASTDSSSGTNGFTPRIDKTLIADDRHPDLIPPPNMGWCPKGKHLACCYEIIDGLWAKKTHCFFYFADLTCEGETFHPKWLCCEPKVNPLDPNDQGTPNPKTCDDPGKGQRPRPPSNPPARPHDIPHRIEQSEDSNQDSVCPRLRTPATLD